MPEAGTELQDALRLMVIPSAVTSLVLMSLFLLFLLLLRWLGWHKAVGLTPWAAALAVAAGVYVGNECREREPLPWQFDNSRPLTAHDFGTVLGWSLESKPQAVDTSTDDPDEPFPARTTYWLAWLAALALLVELLARLPHVPFTVGWVARTLVAVLAGRLLTPAEFRAEVPWASWCLAVTILLEWALLTTLARRRQDGTVEAALALCFGTASVLLLYGHYASLSEVALLFAAAFVGLVLVTWRWLVVAAFVGPTLTNWRWPGDTGSVLAAAAVLLPGLMCLCYREVESAVPWQSFLLLGLAPLALAPLLLPRPGGQHGWLGWVAVLLLPLIPAVVALVLAAQVETLPF